MKLALALTARIPLIRVETDDTLNIGAVLDEISQEDCLPLLEGFRTAIQGSIHYIVNPAVVHDIKWYKQFSNSDATLVLVNTTSVSALLFDGGELVTPRTMIERFAEKYYGGEYPENLVASFGGMSYKDIVEVAKLTIAQFGSLTHQGVQAVRRQFFGIVDGLEQVILDVPFYFPNKKLNEWLEVDGAIMLCPSAPKELRPRGLLFTGPPGTGKTLGAKHLAITLDLPLYLLNIGSLSSKYFSESEKQLMRCLAQAENAAPCILLIDEVEKIFQSNDESGTMQRLLAHLLWWLQEHQENVFVVMTTNDEGTIPPELYRAGRIDYAIEFKKLSRDSADSFIEILSDNVKHIYEMSQKERADILQKLYGLNLTEYSHAEITQKVMGEIKIEFLKNQNI